MKFPWMEATVMRVFPAGGSGLNIYTIYPQVAESAQSAIKIEQGPK